MPAIGNHGRDNDPSGPVYHKGQYHLFFQYNLYDWKWVNMHWGHAVSTDLARWKELPVAIDPDRFPISKRKGPRHEETELGVSPPAGVTCLPRHCGRCAVRNPFPGPARISDLGVRSPHAFGLLRRIRLASGPGGRSLASGTGCDFGNRPYRVPAAQGRCADQSQPAVRPDGGGGPGAEPAVPQGSRDYPRYAAGPFQRRLSPRRRSVGHEGLPRSHQAGQRAGGLRVLEPSRLEGGREGTMAGRPHDPL
ncbi:MAG: hypothetical protein JXB62_21420 [Pirellulales bacterium]|nr:hypothetical protein [Pirellulales bacterium]